MPRPTPPPSPGLSRYPAESFAELDGDKEGLLRPQELYGHGERLRRLDRQKTRLAAIAVGLLGLCGVWGVGKAEWGQAGDAGNIVCAQADPIEPPCLDPYLRHGYIHRGDGTNEISWHPYTPSNLFISDSSSDSPHPSSPIPYSSLLGSSSRATEPQLEFAHDRTILLIGESLDRDNAQYFCSQNKPSEMVAEEGHISYVCRLPDLNLTTAMWFTTGLRPLDTDWYMPDDPKPWTFEERFPQKFLPMLPTIGSPSLVILSSHFWDLKFFQDRHAHSGVGGPFHVSEADLRWHRGRVVELVELTRATFPEARIMWRLGTSWRVNDSAGFGEGNLGVFRLNESTRAVLAFLGVNVFNWAGLIEGEKGYKDGQHLKDGQAAALHTSMMMHYLEKAVNREPLC